MIDNEMAAEANAVGHDARLSASGRIVRSHDRDRFMATLVVPHDRREAILTVYAFNHEVAKIADAVSEPIAGQMRFQWWWDAIAEAVEQDAPVRMHEVATPLGETIRRFGLHREPFEQILTVREDHDLAQDPQPATLSGLEAYAEGTAATPFAIALSILKHSPEHPRQPPEAEMEAVRHMGTAWGLAGTIRAVPHLARRRQCRMPADLLAAKGVDRGDVIEGRASAGLAEVVHEIADRAADHLNRARRLRRDIGKDSIRLLAGCCLVDAHLKRLQQARWNPFDPRLAHPPPLRIVPMAVRSWLNRY